MTRRKRGSGSIFQKGKCNLWVIQYQKDGKQFKEYTGLADWAEAALLLQKRLAEGAPPVRGGAVRIADLHAELVKHNALRDLKCPQELGWRWKHLGPHFGALRARELRTAHVSDYVLARQKAGAANGTINRELTSLKRMYSVGLQSDPPLVERVPHISHLKEAKPRSGFVDYADFARLRFAAEDGPLWLRVFLELAYNYALRFSELRRLRVRDVSFETATIRLDPGTTKNDEGRELTMTPRIAALVRQATRGKGPEDYVLTRPNGRPMGEDIRRAWYKLRAECGLPGLLVHDLRRSGVRNLVNSGVSELVAMTISGHKTRSVFDRYHIVDQRDKRDAMAKLEAEQARQEALSPLVKPPSAQASGKLQ